ncbi:hypothetical protein HGRIS_009457 [Hohenbuehelia grisea]|uniref:BRCT domain-containing protein n=1 Tax=Hohenbuehelia grisea TaxID=104357 RepID=A0ABR3J1L4_9AGAR
MDKYLTVSKPSALRAQAQDSKGKNAARFKPYDAGAKSARKKTKPSDPELSRSALNKILLSTLASEDNPITHSDIYERTQHIVSATTGHQVSEGRAPSSRSAYLVDRTQKLADQKAEDINASELKILRGTRIYINGYLRDTTDIEMKRVVTRAGGEILPTASGATHILTSQQLSSSKTHKILTTKMRQSVQVVRPEWVFDSLDAGKKLQERHYAVIKPSTTKTLHDMFAK